MYTETLLTIGEIARRLGQELHRIEYVIRSRNIQPTSWAGQAFQVASDGCIALGAREPQSGRLVLSPTRTLPTAQAFVHDFHLHSAGPTLVCYAGMLLEWRDNRYREVEDNAARQQLQAWLHDALRYHFNARTKTLELVDFQSNPSTVRSALESVRAHVHLASTTLCPSWLGDAADRPFPQEIVACRSLLLHLPAMQCLPPNPQFFTTCALDFDPDPHAPEPMAWHTFLHQLFDGDLESLDLLQE